MNNFKIPVLSVLLSGIMAMFFLPLMPIDETRYVSVAWEMRNAGSYAVPLLNGEPYTHKPPLLFWLIQISWKLFGVHDAVPRLIPVCFSMLCIFIVYRISILLWPEEKKTASCAALVLGSTILWMLWSCAIMFDILLTFWSLIAVMGILLAENNGATGKGRMLLTLGIAGGLLTKGPVILVYILPVLIFHFLWSEKRSARWRISMFMTVLAGFILAMLWVVPAAVQGGADYCHAVFWSQTVDRVSSSFAHRRPFWWYFPLLPMLFFPWVLFKPVFPEFEGPADKGTRLTLLWLTVPLIILSMISGKQIHYLIPLIPVGALLMGRNIARAGKLSGKISIKIVGAIYILSGLAALSLPFIRLGADIGRLAPGSTFFIAAGLLSAGLILIAAPFRSTAGAAKGLALCTLLALLFSLAGVNKNFLKSYDIKNMSIFIHNKINEGRTVANIGEYHGQYQFLGRLTRPIPVLQKDPASLHDFIIGNPDALLISYLRENEIPENSVIYYRQKYRGKTAMMWCPSERTKP